MQSNLENNQSFNQNIKSGKFSLSRKILTGDDSITLNGSLVNYYDANGSNRIVTLPVLEAGRFYIVSNIGSGNTITVKSATGTTVSTLAAGDTSLVTASNSEWVALAAGAAASPPVFTNTIDGLVPAPNSGVPGSLFLRDDGQWGQVQVTGIVDAFKYITDGTTIAIGSGPDTFKLRSSSGKIGIVVTNNEAVHGDNANFTVNEASVNHNLLLNYVADQHVAHTGVTLTAGLGLSGGGDISASRTFNLDLNDLTADTPVLADKFAFYDVSGADTNNATLTVLNGILDHNALLNYVADQHIAHSGVSIIAGSGLTGGGTIAASRTLSLDINGLTADTLASGDFFAFYDISGVDNNKVTFANLNASLDHNALINYVANQHVDHTTVSISTTEGIQGGGTIAATRTLKLDISGLTADLSPDSANDYVATYDASAGVHKKVLLNLISGGSITEPANDSLTYGRRNTAGVGAWRRVVELAGDTWTGMMSTATANGGVMSAIAATANTIQVLGNSTNAAAITFHVQGVFAGNFGIDTDGVWKVGGWSHGANSYRIIHEGLSSPALLGSPTTTTQAAADNSTKIATTAFVANVAVRYDMAQSLTVLQKTQAWANQTLPAALRGYIDGLILSTAGSSATFGIAAGVANDSTNVDFMILSSAYTKTTSAWAVGTGNGALDTGAVAVSTWYHVWLIKRPDTGVVDVLYSLSASAPTMPANYTLKRRIGSMKTNGSSQWTKFKQDGDEFVWDTNVSDVTASATGTAAVTRTMTVPTGIRVLWRGCAAVATNVAGSSGLVILTDLSNADVGGGNTQQHAQMYFDTTAGLHLSGNGGAAVWTNTSAQIRSRMIASAAGITLYLGTFGWMDQRGKDT